MTWEEAMFPLISEFVMPIALTLAGGAITYVVAQVGGVAKKHLNVDIDTQLNGLLHAALQRAVAAALTKHGMSSSTIVSLVMNSLRKTNPDAIARFDLDQRKDVFAGIVEKEIDAQIAAQKISSPVPPARPDPAGLY